MPHDEYTTIEPLPDGSYRITCCNDHHGHPVVERIHDIDGGETPRFMIKAENGQLWIHCKQCERGNYCDV